MDIRFSSKEAHIIRKELEEKTAIVLMVRVTRNNIVWGSRRYMDCKEKSRTFQG